MSTLVVSPESLASTVTQITESLLNERFEKQLKSYVKIDYIVIEQNQHFTIQVTMCSSCNMNLSILFANVLKNHITSLDNRAIVATVEEKTISTIRVQNVICKRNSTISLVSQPVSDSPIARQKEYALLKRYICIKLLFQVESLHFDIFSSLVLCHIMVIEQFDPNIKFSFKKNNKYIYRNHVRMDDIILSCMLLSSYCANVVQRSNDDDFRQKLLHSLDISKTSNFETTVGCLLLSQADSNFVRPAAKLENTDAF